MPLSAADGGETSHRLIAGWKTRGQPTAIGGSRRGTIGYVIRRVILYWAIVLYIGQTAKDLIRWPRPAFPPAARLEKRYVLEYGMPSTHAMVGFTMPTVILLHTWGRYQYPFLLGLLVSLPWCLLICLSRVYLGMHSVLDVLVGLLVSAILTALGYAVVDRVDYFLMTHPMAPLALLSVGLVLCVAYPEPRPWNTCRSDTITIVAVGVGILLGSWIDFRLSPPPPSTLSTFPLNWPTQYQVVCGTLRMMIGGALLGATRGIVSTGLYRMLCRCYGLDPRDPLSRRPLRIELPLKFLTYISMAQVTVVLAPRVFVACGIPRVTYSAVH